MAATIDRSAGQAGATITEGRRPVGYVWAAARIAIGWIFLWAFLDKTFGWGFATPSDRAWIAGGSPTTGFLKGTGWRWPAPAPPSDSAACRSCSATPG
ncbi:hypothetical protein AB0K12_38895 [Nonomuraea sp. NPDC049419]|uniref:hypothetical protein n=1 Tax=Nonomuraea sp. NPDC049419 TaxID=3155772 RepID=UPI003440FCF4